MVEIHWAFTPRYLPIPLDLERLWERLESVSLVNTSVRVFPPEDLLLILCIHGSKDLWRRLQWICDIAELIHTYPKLNWERVVAQAKALGSERMLLLGLSLASELLGTPLPEEVLK